MNRYTVVWHKDVLGELAEIWTSAKSRNAVTTAAHLIDVELSEDAPTKGVELSEGMRALFAPPLRALFTVNEGDRIVEVLRIRRL